MSNLKFKCPNCGYHLLEEVCVNVTQSWVIRDIFGTVEDDTYADVEYGESETHGGDVGRYQCGGCGYTLQVDGKNITDCGALAAYLFKAGMLKEDTE